MKLSDYVIDSIAARNTEHIFEVCGGALAHLLNSLYGREDIKAVSIHHEQAAAFAAEGYSRAGRTGICMATSGPGATNLITGIGSCFFDSIPCVFITGQVNTYEFKFQRAVRQIGFQETDIVSLVKPVTKYAELVTEPEKIKYCLEKAFYIAASGRPGPVLLDIPMNVQRADIDVDALESFVPEDCEKTYAVPDKKNLKKTVGLIKSSSRPVVLIGGGLRSSGAQDVLFEFIEKTGIPVVSSLMGIDGFTHEYPAYTGMIGTYGNRYANLAAANSDLLIALGTRLDTRQTGTKPDTFARGAKIVHVDIDAGELNNKRQVDLALNFDIKDFLTGLNDELKDFDKEALKPWKDAITGYKEKYFSHNSCDGNSICPNDFLRALSGFLPDNAVVCTDVGQNQIWAAQSMKIKKGQRFFTQGGMGAMGCSLSMAIGAAFADADRSVISIAGDGGFQLNIQELQTVYSYGLPVKVVLLNNNCYGMVRQFQQQYFNSRFQSTVLGYSCPDFQKVVAAYNIPVYKIDKQDDVEDVLKEFFDAPGAGFLEVEIKQDYKVLPKLSVNRPLEDQEPLLPRDELKDNMFIDIMEED